MIRELIVPKEKNPALQKIADMFVKAFAQVGEKIRAELISEYRKYAKYRFERFVEAAETRTGDVYEQTRRGRVFPFSDYHDWSEYKGPSGSLHLQFWEEIRKVIKHFKLTYKTADEKANMAYEGARDSFVFKNLDKMRNVLGDRQDLKNATTMFDLRRGALDGNMQVYLQGAYFRAQVGLKYVVRTIPNLTPYFQYPLVFIDAEVGGKLYKRPSEEELRMLLGATKSRAEERAEIEAAAGFCPMSGKQVPIELWRPVASRMSPYVRCPACKSIVSAARGVFRKHKTPAAGKAEAAQKLETAGYCPKSREKVSQAIIDAMGPVEPYKDPKIQCEHCGQMVRLDSERDWLQGKEFLDARGYSTKMKVKSARYYKHRLEPKA